MNPDPAPDEPTAYLAILAGLPPRAFPLVPGRYILGRSPEVDFHLDDLQVSRRHCEVEYEDGTCWVTDLQSHSGTVVGSIAITNRTALEPGDLLTLGGVQLVFHSGPVPAPADLERLAAAAASFAAPAPILYLGAPALIIPLGETTTIGRDPGSDVVLDSSAVARRQVHILRGPDGFVAVDLQSGAASFANGREFTEHPLVIGDRLAVGPFHFLFDGVALRAVSAVAGGGIHAREVGLAAGGGALIEDFSLDVAPGHFAGIIGVGLSPLIAVLAGRAAPGAGAVTVDGAPASPGSAMHCGFVPRSETVHPELTVAQALDFAARLRFPGRTPPLELRKLIAQTMARCGLGECADARIAALSNAQRKLVCIAVELLAQPSVLILDEPASGLDPAAEYKLMEVLREVADRGCTVLCTVHATDSVHLMDQLSVIAGGRAIFSGTPEEVRDFFGIERFAALYDRIGERTDGEWIALASAAPPPPVAPEPPCAALLEHPPAVLSRLAVLLGRQRAVLFADWRNAAFLALEPLLLAALTAWVTGDSSLRLFFAWAAALWFGCSNAAPGIVRERAIYHRERVAGVTPELYVLGKLLFLGAVTAFQSLLLYGTFKLFGGLAGSIEWQLGALLLSATAGVAIGCLISALARNPLQALLAVPLVLIPLILLSGELPAVSQMRPVVAAVAGVTPSFAARQWMDLSLLSRPGASQDLRDRITLLLWAGGAAAATCVTLRIRKKC